MDISEQILQIEINKLIRKKTGKQNAKPFDTSQGDKNKGNYPEEIPTEALFRRRKKKLIRFWIRKKKNCCA